MQTKIQNIFKSEWLFVRLLMYIFLAFTIININNLSALITSFSISEKENIYSLNTFESLATPMQITIPKINLQAKIIPVGKTVNGNLDVPKSLTDTGWYKNGVKPGEIGNAVIDGHEVDALGFAAIFKNLHLLNIGDNIIIENEDKQKLIFSVLKTEIYPYDAAPLPDIFGTSTKRNLNLITCEGDFISLIKTKNKRLVVYTTLSL